MNPTQWRLRLRGCVGFVTVSKTAVVLSDGSVAHSDSSLNFCGQQYVRISSEEKKDGHSCLRDADDHSFWYWLI